MLLQCDSRGQKRVRKHSGPEAEQWKRDYAVLTIFFLCLEESLYTKTTAVLNTERKEQNGLKRKKVIVK